MPSALLDPTAPAPWRSPSLRSARPSPKQAAGRSIHSTSTTSEPSPGRHASSATSNVQHLEMAFAATPVLERFHACWYSRVHFEWQGDSCAPLNRKVTYRARGSPNKQGSPLHVPAYLREGHAAHDALAKMKAAKQVTWKQVGHQAEL